MKKKILMSAFLILSILYMSPIKGEGYNNENLERINAEDISITESTIQLANITIEEPETIVPETETVIEEVYVPTIQEIAASEYTAHMEKLNTCENKKEWFLEYKELLNKYSNELDHVENIYDYFSEQELNLLFSVVEAELRGFDGFDERCNVASVIFNRLAHDGFGDTLSTVLVASQFSTISNGWYKKVSITEDTILACEYSFLIEDTTNGAIYFESSFSDVHDSYAEYMFSDGSGHKFYKEKEH